MKNLNIDQLEELNSNQLKNINGGALPVLAVWGIVKGAAKVGAAILTLAAAEDAARDFACGLNEGLNE